MDRSDNNSISAPLGWIAMLVGALLGLAIVEFRWRLAHPVFLDPGWIVPPSRDLTYFLLAFLCMVSAGVIALAIVRFRDLPTGEEKGNVDETEHLTYNGPPIDDAEMLAKLPKELAALLQQVNGVLQFHGGLHVRGACVAPAWHSLRDAWVGKNAFHELYPEVTPEDVPFAEDCMGDQFLLRDGTVWHLLAETGEMESLESSFKEFFQDVEDDPGEHLGLHPLLQFQREGGHLQPGQLLAAYPPFCLEEAEDGVTLRALPSDERRRLLAELARQIRDLPEGAKIDVKWMK